MTLFRIGQSNRTAYQFDGEYSWLLPAVSCAVCGRYRGSYLGCPNLSIKGRLDEAAYRSGPPVSQERFEELAAPLKGLMVEDWPLLPGMGFGPFFGRVMKREKRDFLWLFGRTMLIRESAHEGLCRERISLTTGPAVIMNSREPENRTDYVRIAQIRPIVCMAEETLAYAQHKHCWACGLHVLTWPKRLFLRRDSIPAGLDLFAAMPSQSIIATEKFERAIRTLGLTNVAFEPVDLVS